MEPVLLRGCRGIIGLIENEPSFLRHSDIMLNDRGISYKEVDKTGYVIDCKGSIALQSFFNSHTHAAMTLFRNLGDDTQLHAWLSSIWELEARLDSEAVSLGSEKAVVEFLLTGTTGFLDMYFYEMETVKKASEYGLKIMTGPTIMGGYVEVGEVERKFIDFEKKARSYKNVKPVFNVHSIYTVPEDFFRELGETGFAGNPYLHIHVSETKEEVIGSLKKHGTTPIAFLDKHGLVNDKSILVHLGWITNAETEIIREKGAWLVHCPASNMKLATGGFFPLKDFIDTEYKKLLLGTDGAASNDTLSMLEEARIALLLSRNNYWTTSIKPTQTLAMAWRGWLLFDEKKSCIMEGCKPDIYLADIEPVPGDKIMDRIVLNPYSTSFWTLIHEDGVVGENDFERLIEKNRELAHRIIDKLESMLSR